MLTLLAPFKRYLWALVVGLGLALGSYWAIQSYASLKADHATQALELAAAEADLVDLREKAEVAARTETVYVQRAAQVREVTKEIIREVQIPASACALPPAWRVLHDAAATGTPPSSAAAASADGAPAPAAEAAETVADNYGTYHEVAERLKALQSYVKELTK